MVNVKPLIVYGTETGNAKSSLSYKQVSKGKINAKSVDIFQFDVKKLEKKRWYFSLSAMQGEGDFRLMLKIFEKRSL